MNQTFTIGKKSSSYTRTRTMYINYFINKCH